MKYLVLIVYATLLLACSDQVFNSYGYTNTHTITKAEICADSGYVWYPGYDLETFEVWRTYESQGQTITTMLPSVPFYSGYGITFNCTAHNDYDYTIKY